MSVKLAHFDLIGQIGRGGMGTVFSAFDTSLQRHVAIKVLDEDRATDTEFVNDFIREAQNAAGISHPHIVQIYFAGECDGNYYIVMELLTGQTLDSLVQKEGPQPEPLALRIAIEVTEALKAAYAKEMVHGDVKPLNIMLTESSGSKLLDFGLAKLANVEADAKAEDIWGSPYYVSPERIGRKAEDFRSDIYSLGATIFELLTGRPPFVGENNEELAIKRLREKPPLVRTLNPNVSKKTEQILDKMLQKSPLQRYLDYDALLNDLWKAEAAVLGKTANVDTAEIMRVTRKIPVPPPKSNLPLILGSVVGVVLVAAVVAYLALGHKSEPAKTVAVESEPVKSAPVVTTAAPSSPTSETTTAAKKKQQLPTPGIFTLDNKEVAVWPPAGVPGRPLLIVVNNRDTAGSTYIKGWLLLAQQHKFTVVCPTFEATYVDKQFSDGALSNDTAYFGDCLKWIEKNLQYDKGNVFMTGYAGGALTVWLLATKNSDFFKGLFLSNLLFPKDYSLTQSGWHNKPIKLLFNPKGTDEVQNANIQAIQALKAAGGSNFSTEAAPSGSNGGNSDGPLVVDWMEKIASGSPQASSQ